MHPKVKKRGAERSINALSIAEQQFPIKLTVRSSRLGEIHERDQKRKRLTGDEDSGQESLLRDTKKRDSDSHGLIDEHERGSDSDGNTWVLGQVNNESDSDINSDEAFGASDEEKFEGFRFRGDLPVKLDRKIVKNPRKLLDVQGDISQGVSLYEDENEDEQKHLEESDDLGADAIDLADALDDGEDEAKQFRQSENFKRSKYKESHLKLDDSETGSESAADREESIFSGSDAEGDTEDDAVHLTKLASLQKFVTTLDGKDQNVSHLRNSTSSAQESVAPSEFGISSGTKLTVADLIPSITDSHLKKSLRLLADSAPTAFRRRTGIPRKLEVPLPKRQQDRLDRAAAFESSKETLNRWIDTVKHNRRAEHLSFPLQRPQARVNQGIERVLSATQPQSLNSLESTIRNILLESGLAATQQGADEDREDDLKGLKTNKIALQAIQARRANLRKARDLLFREEIRSKRIKKIKSKSYRRVHRKEREKFAQEEKIALTGAGVDDSEIDKERNDRRRAEERMGARHRDSKWAKGVKDDGRAAWDEEARGGIVEMARRGEELRRRIEGKETHANENDSISSETDSEDVSEDYNGDLDQSNHQKSQDRLRKLEGMNDELDGVTENPKSGLFSMKFMKNADALRKAKNDADVESLQKELAGEDRTASEQDEEGFGRRHYGPTNPKHSTNNTGKQLEHEFEERDFSYSDEEPPQGKGDEEDREIIVGASTNGLPSKGAGRDRRLTKNSHMRAKLSRAHIQDSYPENTDNPWLVSDNGSRMRDRNSQNSVAAAIITNTFAPRDSTPHRKDNTLRSAGKVTTKEENYPKITQTREVDTCTGLIHSDTEDEDSHRLPFVLRDQDLIRKAFAGDDVMADFEKEKQDATHNEEEKMIENVLPGWGSWTGAGTSKKEQKRQSRTVTKQDGIPKGKRQDAKLDRVIINEKRVKKVRTDNVCCETVPSPNFLEYQISSFDSTAPVRNAPTIRKVTSTPCWAGMDDQGNLPVGHQAKNFDEAGHHRSNAETNYLNQSYDKQTSRPRAVGHTISRIGQRY